MLAHELVELLAGVLPRRRGAASRSFRSSSICRIRSTSCGVTFCIACFMPGEALVEQLPAEQVADLLVGLAGLGASASRSRPARGPRRRCRTAARRAAVSRNRASSESSRTSAARSASSARSSSSRTSCSVPSSRLSRCRSAAPLPQSPGQVVEPAALADARAAAAPAAPSAASEPSMTSAADLVQRRAQVDRRGERIGSVDVRAVGVAAPQPAVTAGSCATG